MLKYPLLLLLITISPSISSNLGEFLSGNVWFSAAAYQESRKIHDGNFLICPISAEIIMALAHSGAKDETAEEIRSSLHLPSQVDSAMEVVLPTLKCKNNLNTFHIANKIYIKDKYPIKSEFEKVATEIYEASIENIDFSNQEEAAKAINKWVEEQTDSKIDNIINPDKLSDETRSVLINALYFKGYWRKAFKRLSTKKCHFYTMSGETREVDTMHRCEHFGYFLSDELKAQFLEMPFKKWNASMIIALPNDKAGLPTLEEQITNVIQSPKFQREYVNVALPKFKIETSTDFKQIFKNLGMSKAFSHADFSGISGEKGEIYISDVAQKAFISINEKGVEAGGSTFASLFPKSLSEIQPGKEFIVDHPFIFYIKVNNIVVFVGRVMAP